MFYIFIIPLKKKFFINEVNNLHADRNNITKKEIR